jgi:hypothetical protein
MKSSAIAVDPAALRRVRPSVDALADAFEAIRTGLDDALAAEGRCWGWQEWGAAFAASYEPASVGVRSLLAATATGIDDLSAVLELLAEAFMVAEHEARRGVA